MLGFGLVLAWLCPPSRAADFPRWRGAGSNGSAGETTMPLAGSWDEARVGWVSEALSPHPWNHSVVRGRTQWPRTVLGNGGYCMPAVWEGKVYVSIWRPSGSARAGTKWAATGLPGYVEAHADQVIVCMDALTGRTLWEAVWQGTEWNQVEAYGGHNNICIANAKAYAIGNSGLMYCAEARSGRRLWSARIGPSANPPNEPGARAARAAPGAEPPHPMGGSLDSNTYNICPVVADGVAVTGDRSNAACLVGFDAETGKELWRQRSGASGLVPPLRWTHQGREYLVVGSDRISCLEPKTGKVLWTAGSLGNTGYDQATPAIEGDYLVAHGPWKDKSLRDLPMEKKEGWVCYKLSPQKAEKLWALSGAYLGGSYIAPVIHRGYVWLNFERGEGTEGLTECDTDGRSSAMACVELAGGKVVSEIGGLTMNSVCPGPLAMGDLLIYQGGEYLWLMSIADPKAPKLLGVKPQPVNLCSSASGADGLVYFRGAERLVNCLDVRKPQARAGARHDDPLNARFDLILEGGQRDGGTPRFHLRGRGGKFPQSWATVPPDYAYPDVLHPGDVRLEGNQLVGQVSALLRGAPYGYKLRAALKDGAIEGEFEDTYCGVPVQDSASGTALARADRNAVFTLYWPRHWVGGQNQGHEHKLFVTVNDGKVTKVELVHRVPSRPGISAKTESFDLTYANGKLTGSAVLQVTTDHVAVSGRYRVNFDLALAHNLFSGKVHSTRDGAPTTTHAAWGMATVPPSERFSPADAVYTLDLKNGLIMDNDKDGTFDTRLYLSTQGGKVIGGTASAGGTSGLHRVDASGLRLEGDRLVGRVEVWVQPDGYALRAASHNIYNLDLKIKGTEVGGRYEGTYDAREPRRGRITGTYVNEG
jgi:outer membrane protein assembly factor BamB